LGEGEAFRAKMQALFRCEKRVLQTEKTKTALQEVWYATFKREKK